VYNLAAFASSFPYPSVEVGVVAYGGRNGGLRSRVGRNIGKVIIGVLSGID